MKCHGINFFGIILFGICSSFLDLQICVFHQILKTLSIISSNILSAALSPFLRLQGYQYWVFVIVWQVSNSSQCGHQLINFFRLWLLGVLFLVLEMAGNFFVV